MRPKTFFSEQPIQEVWRRLLHYTYADNLQNHMVAGASLGPAEAEDAAASMLQAHEYFAAADSVSLHTEPLQLYYGAVSLLRATTILRSGSCPTIDHHGMSQPAPVTDSLDLSTVALGSPTGGVRVYADVLDPHKEPAAQQNWSLAVVFGSLPDLYDDFRNACGTTREPLCLPIERITDANGDVLDRLRSADLGGVNTPFVRIRDYAKAYLPAQDTGAGFVICRHRPRSQVDLSVTSLSGARFFQVGCPQGKTFATVSEPLLFLLGLFILGTMSRYFPREWGAIVRSASSRRQLLERFLIVAKRKLPNLALDLIVGDHLVFTSARIGDTDARQYVQKPDVNAAVEDEVRKQLTALRGK